MICELCKDKREFAANGFPSHLIRIHKITQQEYYDTFIEPNTEHPCETKECPNNAKFKNLLVGYGKYCCGNCARRDILKKNAEKYGVSNISQVPHIKEKMREGIKANWNNLSEDERAQRCENISTGTKLAMKESVERLNEELNKYAKENNLFRLSNLIDKYGSGFIQSESLDIHCVEYKHRLFVPLEEVTLIENYASISTSERRENTNLLRYGVSNPVQSKEIQDKIKQTNIEKYGVENVYQSEDIKNKCKETKQTKYGDENYNNREKAAKTMIDKYGSSSYVSTEEFKEKVNANKYELHIKTGSNSKAEAYIIEKLISLGINVIANRKFLGTQYIDIFLPDFNIGIEHNGLHWHSIENGKSKDYHLSKSLIARELGIRLIHIYEFEDLDYQISLLVDLLNGKDNYHKNDFNKNNLIDNIPEPIIIYKNKNCTIYGAGKLYET